MFDFMSDDKNTVRASKFLTLIIRHEPEKVGLQLDEAGWVGVDELLAAVNRNGLALTLEQLKSIVANNDKKRFAFSEDGVRIRASQGHSVEVDLKYSPQTPPEWLYHGTPERFVESIRTGGLHKGERHHVHLAADEATASKVGERRGRRVILKIRAGEMHRAGHAFFRSDNGVWLAESVPGEFIEFPA